MGIAGGRDREAFYLVGLDSCDISQYSHAHSNFFYLDPHVVQASVPGNWKESVDTESQSTA